MSYTYACSADGFVAKTEAMTDDLALDEIVEQLKSHTKELHPEVSATSDEDLKEMVKSGWQKLE